MDTPHRSPWIDLAAALSIAAGLVHAAAAGTHTGDSTLVALFTIAALVQGGVGMALLRAPSPRLLTVTASANVACLAAWAVSRTIGWPLVAALAEPEAVGRQDLTAALLAAAAVAAAIAGRRVATTRAPAAPRLAWAPVLVLVPALVGVSAPHAHGSDGHAHEEQAAAHEHPTSEATGVLASDPILTGADTGHASEADLTAAVDLVETTRAAVDAGMDTEAAEAAGYVWIGDGRRTGGYQHYIHPEHLRDGVELDPERIESLVFENTASGPVLVSTMYVLETGSTMADVPDVAGDLTVWHDHQNLCWDASGTRLAGVSTDGKTCRPAGTLRATPPMLHVWLVDNPCGPFAGVEGHGSGDCSTHEH